MARFLKGLIVTKRRAPNPIKGHNPSVGKRPLNRGQLKPTIIFGVCRKFRCCRTFKPQIQLTENNPLKMGDDFHWAQPPRSWRQNFNKPGSEIKSVNILLKCLFNIWPQHFNSNQFICLAHAGFVNLCNRSRCNRFAKF